MECFGSRLHPTFTYYTYSTNTPGQTLSIIVEPLIAVAILPFFIPLGLIAHQIVKGRRFNHKYRHNQIDEDLYWKQEEKKRGS